MKEDPVIGQYEKELFSGNSGFDVGEFICTYVGHVKRGDKLGKKQSRFLMQLGTTYLIDGQDSNSFDRFINHGCSASANARTQFIVTQSCVYLGIVALKRIGPNEQIFMDYGGVLPQKKVNPTITGVILNCTCTACTSGPPSRRKIPKAMSGINLSKASAEEWLQVGRCPDIGILGMNDSTSNSGVSQDQTLIDQDDNKSVWTS